MTKVFDSLNDILNAIGEKTSSSIEITKLSFYVNEQERILADAKKKLGDFYFTKLLTEEVVDEEILEVFEKGKDAQERIAGAKMKIRELEEIVNEPITPGKKTCGVCGELVFSSANYCPECGAAFAEEVEPEEETSDIEEDEKVEDSVEVEVIPDETDIPQGEVKEKEE